MKVGHVGAESIDGLGLYVTDIWPNLNPGNKMLIAYVRMRLGLPGVGIVLNSWRVMAGPDGAWLAAPFIMLGYGKGRKPMSLVNFEDQEVKRAAVAFVLEESL